MRRPLHHQRLGNKSLPWVWVTIFVAALAISVGGWLIREYYNRAWLGFERFTVVEFGQEIEIKTFDPQTLTGIKITLPANLVVDTSEGRGSWKAQVLPEMVKKWGWRWAADSITGYLGITYTGVVGHMPLWDTIAWKRWEGRVRWKEIDLKKVNLVETHIESDGQKGLRLASSWDQVARDWFISVSLAEEELAVRITNATTLAGLGAKMAKPIERNGIRVIEVGTADQNKDYLCEIDSGQEYKNYRTVRFLQKNLGCGLKIGAVRNSAAEIEIVIGKKYGDKWVGE